MSDYDRHILRQLADLWSPWFEVTHTQETIMPWHAKRCDNGSVFHAKDPRTLHDAISDNYYDPKPPRLALIVPAS